MTAAKEGYPHRQHRRRGKTASECKPRGTAALVAELTGRAAGLGGARLGWAGCCAMHLLWFVDVGEARVLPGEKKALLSRVASDL